MKASPCRGRGKGFILGGIVFITIPLNSLFDERFDDRIANVAVPDCPRLIVHTVRAIVASLMNYFPPPLPLFFLFSFLCKRIVKYELLLDRRGRILFSFRMGNGTMRVDKVGLISQSSCETRTPLRDPLRGDLLSLFERVEMVRCTGWHKRKEDDPEETK